MEKLGRFLGAFFGAFLCVVLLMGIYSIAEDITLTTYYPAPYGAYDELTTTGNTYLATTSGNVGIGTTNPQADLDISGTIAVSGTSGVSGTFITADAVPKTVTVTNGIITGIN